MSKKTMGPKSKSRKAQAQAQAQQTTLTPDDYDAIDAFAEQRARIGLESDEERWGDADDFGEEAVLNVPDADGSEDEAEGPAAARAPRATKKDKLPGLRAKNAEKARKASQRLQQLAQTTGAGDDDLLEDRLHREASDDEENAAAAWGRARRNYYAEGAEAGDAEAVAQMAQEARRLQRKRLAALRADDFLLPGATQERATAPSRAKVVFDDLSEFLNEPEPEHEHEQDDPLPQPEEDTEELLALLQDFKARLEMLRAQLVPLMAQARATGTNPGVGLTFLQAKYHVLLAYCASVAYYLLLKSRGARVAGHPVLRRLVRHRLLLEKLRPLEQKLRPHIEKALSAVAERAGGALRANPAALVVDGDADTDTDAQDTETAKEAPRAYRPPKLAPAHYPEDAPARDSTERLRRAASRSRLLAELRGELDDAPDEEASDPVRMATRAHTDAAALQRDAYEEQNFMRFQPSRRDRAALRTNARPLDELDDLDDFFGELDALNGAGAGAARPGARKRAAASIGAFLAAPPDAAPAHVAAPYAGSDESAVEDDAHVAPRAERKRARRAERLATRAALRPPVAHRPLRDLDAAAPRPASYAMLKNRGLAPTRSREQRNPRLKQRSRYERAVKRLSSARGGALRADTSRPYPGEATGIRTNLSKSVRFK